MASKVWAEVEAQMREAARELISEMKAAGMSAKQVAEVAELSLRSPMMFARAWAPSSRKPK